ncbi:MAG: DUF3348 family protein [Halioglobus sp.]
MTQASFPLTPSGSRLIRCLTDLAVTDIKVSQSHFAQRLAQLIDLADSITISSAHGKYRKPAAAAPAAAPQTINDEFLRVRTSILHAIMKSFAASAGPSRIKLPVPAASRPVDNTEAFTPYLTFYTAHQAQIDARVRGLHLRVREMATSVSPELAQLAALDTALGNTLAVHARKSFAVIPGLLRQHFDHLLNDNARGEDCQSDSNKVWMQLLQGFCSTLQGLLLAETEARLLPVLGLVEAINADIDKTTYE